MFEIMFSVMFGMILSIMFIRISTDMYVERVRANRQYRESQGDYQYRG